MVRPISENAAWEQANNPDQPFDYDAEPNIFYLDVESIGNLDPDMIVQQGIFVLQKKLALTVSELTGEGENGHAGGPEDAEMMGAGDRTHTSPQRASTATWVHMEMLPGEPAHRLHTVLRRTARALMVSKWVSSAVINRGCYEGYKTGLSMLDGVSFSLVLY